MTSSVSPYGLRVVTYESHLGELEGMCPNAYAYAYDESSNTALWTCDSGLAADFALTFCPPYVPSKRDFNSSDLNIGPLARFPPQGKLNLRALSVI
jgi:hypothetical protein